MLLLVSIDSSPLWPWANATDTRSSTTAPATALHDLEIGFICDAFDVGFTTVLKRSKKV